GVERLATGPLNGPMSLALQPVELRPSHAGFPEPRCQRLLSVLGFVGRRVSPRPFGFREAVDPRLSSASYPSAMGMVHALLRRTGRWRQSAARCCSSKPLTRQSYDLSSFPDRSMMSSFAPPLRVSRRERSHAPPASPQDRAAPPQRHKRTAASLPCPGSPPARAVLPPLPRPPYGTGAAACFPAPPKRRWPGPGVHAPLLQWPPL